MTDEEKLYLAYYEPDRLWTCGKAIKELHNITPMLKIYIKSWLAILVLWQVYIPPRKEIHHPHYDATKPNEQHQFDLLYMQHNLFEGNTYKYILTGIDVASRYKVVIPLRTKKSIKRVVRSNILSSSSVIIDQSLNMKWQSCLRNPMLRFEEQKRNIGKTVV